MRLRAVFACVVLVACTGDDDGDVVTDEPAPIWNVAPAMVGYTVDTVSSAPDGDAFVLVHGNGRQLVRRWRADSNAWNGLFDVGFAEGGGSVAIDQSGAALVAWPMRQAIDAATFKPGEAWASGWSAPSRAIEPRGVVAVASVVSEAGGHAAMMWLEQADNVAGGFQLWVAVLDPKTGWGTPRQLSDTHAWGKLALAEVGGELTLVAAWQDGDGVRADVLTLGGGWSGVERIDEGDAMVAHLDGLAIDRRGEVTALVRTFDGERTRVSAVRRGVFGWSSKLLAEQAVGESFPAALAVDREGAAIAVWASRCPQACGVRVWHRAGEGAWLESADLLPQGAAPDLVLEPRVVISGDVAMAMWSTQTSNRRSLWTSWFNGHRWSPATELRTIAASEELFGYALSMGDGGGAAAWGETVGPDDELEVHAATFVR